MLETIVRQFKRFSQSNPRPSRVVYQRPQGVRNLTREANAPNNGRSRSQARSPRVLSPTAARPTASLNTNPAAATTQTAPATTQQAQAPVNNGPQANTAANSGTGCGSGGTVIFHTAPPANFEQRPRSASTPRAQTQQGAANQQNNNRNSNAQDVQNPVNSASTTNASAPNTNSVPPLPRPNNDQPLPRSAGLHTNSAVSPRSRRNATHRSRSRRRRRQTPARNYDDVATSDLSLSESDDVDSEDDDADMRNGLGQNRSRQRGRAAQGAGSSRSNANAQNGAQNQDGNDGDNADEDIEGGGRNRAVTFAIPEGQGGYRD